MKLILVPFAFAALAAFWLACLAITLWQLINGRPLSLTAEEDAS